MFHQKILLVTSSLVSHRGDDGSLHIILDQHYAAKDVYRTLNSDKGDNVLKISLDP